MSRRTGTSLPRAGNASLWDAPPNAKSASLVGVELRAPDSSEALELIAEAKAITDPRARAYRTPVTEKTLRRKVR